MSPLTLESWGAGRRTGPRARGPALRWLAGALLAASAFGACTRETPSREFPEGTVLVVAGVPLTAADVDRVAEPILRLYPQFAPEHRRRLALTNVIFPRIAGRALAGVAREEARRRVEDLREAAALRSELGPPAELVEGNWVDLTLEVWVELQRLEPGELSAVFEVPGAFVVARLLGRDRAPRAAMERFRAELARFVYHESRGALDMHVFELPLEIVDPDWDHVVPAQWKIPMRRGA